MIADVAANIPTRPANRPSRRRDIVAAAADLLATDSPELISVGDIARHAGLTSAAIYYHFRSRDDLIDEIVTGFSAEWSVVLKAALDDLEESQQFASLVDLHCDWVEAHSRRAMVYFVSSIGATISSETVRRETRYALAAEVGRTLERVSPPQAAVDVTVRALALVTLLEVGSTEMLRPSPSYKTLGQAELRTSLSRMLERLVA